MRMKLNSKIRYESGDTFTPSDLAEVVDFGKDLFASEELVDHAYGVYLAIMVDRGWEAECPDVHLPDFAVMYSEGLYLCGVRRSVITHQYDEKNDTVPSVFSVWMGDKVVECFREIDRVTRPWVTAARGRHFRHSSVHFETDPAKVTTFPLTLADDGRIIPAIVPGGEDCAGFRNAVRSFMPSIAINLYCDRRHLWQVRTAEPVLGRPTPLTVGISEEHVKSLFYARSLPVTETGRKRPILHWVRAHQRRLQDGIDVDVGRHLRGIERFEMAGFEWAITDPVKPERRTP